jgi:hypothetical protein
VLMAYGVEHQVLLQISSDQALFSSSFFLARSQMIYCSTDKWGGAFSTRMHTESEHPIALPVTHVYHVIYCA